MATLDELLESKRIEEVDDVNAPDARKKRQLYIMVPEASDDIARMIGQHFATWNTSIAIEEQVIGLFHDYLSGKCLHHPEDFHVLREMEDGIWELKTDDVRVFGWFISKDEFVIATAAYADLAKDGKYASFISTAKFRRRALALNNGTFVKGEEPSNVISNFRTT